MAETGGADADVHVTPPADLNDVSALAQKPPHLFNGTHRRRQADFLDTLLGQRFQPRDRQRQVRAALRSRHRVNLIYDQRANRAQHLARFARSEKDEQRFRGCN